MLTFCFTGAVNLVQSRALRPAHPPPHAGCSVFHMRPTVAPSSGAKRHHVRPFVTREFHRVGFSRSASACLPFSPAAAHRSLIFLCERADLSVTLICTERAQ